MTFSNITRGLLLGLSLLAVVGCNNSNTVNLQGAGATFPYPLYSKMFDSYYKEFGIQINYQAIGSGGGIRQLKNETVDFGASDAFMKDKALKESKNPILHIPICLGAVAITYNLPGVDYLNLTPELISGIFLGTIKKWNDAKVQAINSHVTLPNLPIVSVHRSEGSGTTFIFTDYLSKVSSKWLSGVGRGKSVNWPDGLGGKGNAGVAGIIQNTPGSIGYLGHVYALQNKMPLVKVKNKDGQFVEPSIEAVSNAANTKMPADTRASITNTSAKNGYPISGFTWILAYQNQDFKGRSYEQAKATKTLIEWMITDAQRFVSPLHYAPLSESVTKKAKTIVNSIHFAGKEL